MRSREKLWENIDCRAPDRRERDLERDLDGDKDRVTRS
jgi:hypothetical protein